MKFEREYYVGIKDIGLKNQMTNYAFLSFLEEIASAHSDEVGYGVNDIETKKKVWLLMDWKLEVFKRPKFGAKLKVKTWARPIGKQPFSTYRDFEIYEEDKKVGIATSKWILFDLETNRIAKITDDIIDLYSPKEENVFEETEIKKLKEPQNLEKYIYYDIKRSDIDINKHLHNLNYLKLAYETLPEDVYMGEERKNLRIMYKHQILFGDKVKCYYNKIDEKEVVTIKSEDNSILHAIIELS